MISVDLTGVCGAVAANLDSLSPGETGWILMLSVMNDPLLYGVNLRKYFQLRRVRRFEP